MKQQAKNRLIKDIVMAVVTWVIIGIIITTGIIGSPIGFLYALAFAGLPFGWRWMSKVITARGFITVLVKAFLSALLGFLAIFVVIIGDIISYNTAKD